MEKLNRSNNTTQSCKKSLQKYQLKQRIGKGLTAEVYKAKDTVTNKDVCVKIINTKFYHSKLGSKLINNQINLLNDLNHPNILRFIQNGQLNQKIALVSELCESGSLQKLINANKRIQSNEALLYMKDIVEGCLHLKSKNIIHRDLKPQNILFRHKNVVIVDFGFALKKGNQQLFRIDVGSPLYMAPQVLESLQFSDKSQIFALGVIWYEMLTGFTPWKATNEKDLLNKIKNIKPNLKYTNQCPKITSLILKCLSLIPAQRPQLQQMKQVIELCSNFYSKKLDDQNVIVSGKNKSKTILGNIYNTYVPPKKYIHCTRNKNKSFNHYDFSSVTYKQTNKIADQQFCRLLSGISVYKLTFLPKSVISKLDLIISKYRNIMGIDVTLPMNEQIEGDKLVIRVRQCMNEKELCVLISEFVRQLDRLGRSYGGIDWMCCLLDRINSND